jgi:hypothetical protein
MFKLSIDNPAVPVRDGAGNVSAQEKFTDCCANPLLFAMRDKYHDFSMSLLTILECLRLAEKEGHVPPLPEGWWVQLANRYNLRL